MGEGDQGETARGQILAVLREAFEGPAHEWSYFTDTRPNTGIFGTIEPLSASEASRDVAGTSIAAHVYHVTFALDVAAARIRGDRGRRDWSESWRLRMVDDAGWEEVRTRLRRGYEDLRRAVEGMAMDDEMQVGTSLAAVAHAAYHLGAIRQKAAVLQATAREPTAR